MGLRHGRHSAGILLVALLIFVPLRANADSVTLTVSPVSGTPGSTVTVDGTITNTGSDTVYLNSESFTLGSSSLINGDTADFFLNAPVSLSPAGGSSGLIAIFTFEIEPGTSGGTYPGNFLDIVGGGPSDFTDVVGGSGFSVDVLGAKVAEPSVLWLLAAGLVGLLPLWRKGRAALPSNSGSQFS